MGQPREGSLGSGRVSERPLPSDRAHGFALGSRLVRGAARIRHGEVALRPVRLSSVARLHRSEGDLWRVELEPRRRPPLSAASDAWPAERGAHDRLRQTAPVDTHMPGLPRPQRGQTSPPGQRSCTKYSRHASSVAGRVPNSCRSADPGTRCRQGDRRQPSTIRRMPALSSPARPSLSKVRPVCQ